MLDVEEIMLGNKSFDIISSFQGVKKSGQKSTLLVSGLGQEDLTPEEDSKNELENIPSLSKKGGISSNHSSLQTQVKQAA